MKDRITVAWELRREIHAWVSSNRASTIQELFAAFPNHNEETVRKAVYKLRADGDVMLNGRRGVAGRLFALTAHIKPEWVVRQALHEGQMNSRMDKYQQAESVRQKILDMCNRVGCVTSKAVAEELGINMDHALRSLTRMWEQAEVQRHGSGKTISFTPLKTKTMPADDMRDRAENRKKSSIKKDMAKQAERSKPCEPWRTRSCDVRNPYTSSPYKDQGGQGNLRREFGIQSVMA